MNKDNKYVSIYIPPYIDPKRYNTNRGYGSIIVLSLITSVISVGIIVLGVYLGK